MAIREKISLNEFRKIRDEVAGVCRIFDFLPFGSDEWDYISNAEISAAINKILAFFPDLEVTDKNSPWDIDSEYVSKYMTMRYSELEKYDLSDIPKEEWGGESKSSSYRGILLDKRFLDLSGTSANIDFSIISLPYFESISNIKGCNLSNVDIILQEDVFYSNKTFDDQFINNHKDYFLLRDEFPEISEDEFNSLCQRYYSQHLHINDLIAYGNILKFKNNIYVSGLFLSKPLEKITDHYKLLENEELLHKIAKIENTYGKYLTVVDNFTEIINECIAEPSQEAYEKMDSLVSEKILSHMAKLKELASQENSNTWMTRFLCPETFTDEQKEMFYNQQFSILYYKNNPDLLQQLCNITGEHAAIAALPLVQGKLANKFGLESLSSLDSEQLSWLKIFDDTILARDYDELAENVDIGLDRYENDSLQHNIEYIKRCFCEDSFAWFCIGSTISIIDGHFAYEGMHTPLPASMDLHFGDDINNPPDNMINAKQKLALLKEILLGSDTGELSEDYLLNLFNGLGKDSNAQIIIEKHLSDMACIPNKSIATSLADLPIDSEARTDDICLKYLVTKSNCSEDEKKDLIISRYLNRDIVKLSNTIEDMVANYSNDPAVKGLMDTYNYEYIIFLSKLFNRKQPESILSLFDGKDHPQEISDFVSYITSLDTSKLYTDSTKANDNIWNNTIFNPSRTLKKDNSYSSQQPDDVEEILFDGEDFNMLCHMFSEKVAKTTANLVNKDNIVQNVYNNIDKYKDGAANFSDMLSSSKAVDIYDTPEYFSKAGGIVSVTYVSNNGFKRFRDRNIGFGFGHVPQGLFVSFSPHDVFSKMNNDNIYFHNDSRQNTRVKTPSELQRETLERGTFNEIVLLRSNDQEVLEPDYVTYFFNGGKLDRKSPDYKEAHQLAKNASLPLVVINTQEYERKSQDCSKIRAVSHSR